MLGLLAACNPEGQQSSAQTQVAEAEPDPDPSTTETPSESTAEVTHESETGGSQTDGQTDGETGEPGEVPLDVVEAPPGYGVFKFATEPPTDEQLTLHAAAGYEVVAIHAAPRKDSDHVGFLRIGTRLRATEKIVNDDCPRGWHQLEGGGYACASRGLMVDAKPPFMSYQPAAPRVAEPFPYDWAYVRQWNTPQWWQVPNAEQLAATRELRVVRESERTGEPLPGTEPAAGGTGGGGGESDAALPPPDGEGGEAAGDGGGEAGNDTPEPAPPEPAPDPAPDPAAEPEPEEEKEPVNIPFSPSMPWLEKGYFLSLGETIRDGDRSYWRTARGGVVEKSNAHPYEPRDFHGAELFSGVDFPVGFVMVKGGTKLLELGKDDKLHSVGKQLDKRAFLDLGEEVEINGRAYFTVLPYPPPEPTQEAGDGGEDADGEPQLLVKADIMRMPDLQPIPKGLDAWDRWIDVDITKQMLVAYEGSRPVYVTLVSTGKKGSDEEPFETPTGRFRIRSKQITSNMDGATATDGNYAIQDVPWVMYFQGSYALHGAFWHESFGYVRSHGCVNLGPTDARWLFYWTTPFVPEFWHGVSSSDDNPGTTIVIRRSPE